MRTRSIFPVHITLHLNVLFDADIIDAGSLRMVPNRILGVWEADLFGFLLVVFCLVILMLQVVHVSAAKTGQPISLARRLVGDGRGVFLANIALRMR